MSRIKKNVFYNVLYQLLLLIVPLVTVPYVSRTLGANGVGTYSYTYSIVYYFMMFSMLGINNYGNRTIAKTKGDKKMMSKNFWSIYYIQLIMSLLMMTFYCLYVVLLNPEYITVSIIQSLCIVSAMIDINWFFFGLEEFKLTLTRSGVLKILSLVLVFTLVKTNNDVWKYTLIMSATTLLSQMILWPFLNKRVVRIKITINDIKEHIKPCLLLFCPVIAVSLYKIMDKVMLGFLVNVTELGFYEQAEKIISVPGVIITAIGTVMLPRMSNLISQNNNSQVRIYIEKSIKTVFFLAFPMMFGIITVSNDFVPLFLGAEFDKSIILLELLSSTIIFSSFANIIRTEYLIPYEKDRIYVSSVIAGAVINLVVNIILIPKMYGIGACIGTISAEFIVLFIQAWKVKDELSIGEYIKSSIPFFITSAIMFIIIYPIRYINIGGIYRILIQVLIGFLTYSLLNVKYISSLIKKRVH